MNIREFKAIAFVMKVFWTIVCETFVSIQDALPLFILKLKKILEPSKVHRDSYLPIIK